MNWDKSDAYFESEKFKKDIQEWAEKRQQKENILKSQLERFHAKVVSGLIVFNELVDKLIQKYDSENYVMRWYSRGIEPPNEFYWFLFEYAKLHGRTCKKKEWHKYRNTFTSSLFYVSGFYFNRMDGQGSCILIEKENKDGT